jgi:UDP-glucose 4-epimerase
MNIIVTGAAGFIGGRLVKELRAAGHRVYTLDKKALKSSEDHYVVDLSDPKAVDLEFPTNIDVIFHLAAQSGGYYSLGNPNLDCEWNVLGTLNVKLLATKLGVRKVVYTSSMAVYGNGVNFNEDHFPKPVSYYGVSKLAGEYYIKLLQTLDSIPFTIFRLFATYGAGQDLENNHQGILSIYLSQALKGNRVDITGSKSRIRQLVHVNDVVNALMMGLTSNTDNQIYNVLNTESLTPEVIIQEISHCLEKELIIYEMKGYSGDQTVITGDVGRLLNLGWFPNYSLKDGVKEFIDNIK